MSDVEPKAKYHSYQSLTSQTIQWTNQNSKQAHVKDSKRGNRREKESPMVLLLLNDRMTM